MDGNTLGDRIKLEVRTAFGTKFTDIPDDHELPDYDEDTLQTILYRAIGRAIVEYLQTSATVTGYNGGGPIIDGRVN